MGVKPTYELAMAAGKDVANKRMRKAGRTAWNRDDYNAAAVEVNRLLKIIEDDKLPKFKDIIGLYAE